MKKTTLLLLLLLPFVVIGQSSVQKVFIQDIENFWVAYDSIRSTTDTLMHVRFINELYINKASEGLKAFLKNKDKADAKWLNLIKSDVNFWDNIRPKTLLLKDQIENLEQKINYFNTLYSDLKEARTYFIIGFRQQGGTVRNNLSIIGTEVVMSDSLSAVSELVRMSIHEYVHTQQKKPDFRKINVLTSSIREGACDFMSELVTQKPFSSDYINYGMKNEIQIWKIFKQDMLTSANNLWTSTGNNPILPSRDLGYYIGYAICKSYYNTITDKKQAIKNIIELDYANQDSVISFLKKSDYETYILSKGYNQADSLEKGGYISKSNTITFLFKTSDKNIIADNSGNHFIFDSNQLGNIKTISVVGDFNGWDHKNALFQLIKNKKGEFALTIDKEKLGKKGDKVKFKFVINHTYWVEPRFEISNRISDAEGNTSLYIQL